MSTILQRKPEPIGHSRLGATVSPAGDPVDAFLRNGEFDSVRFVPENIKDFLADQAAVEKSYFTSLANLATLYNWPLDQLIVSEASYPYNIHQSFEIAKQFMLKSDYKLKLAILNDETHPATLATVKEFQVRELFLYYVPIQPYYRLKKRGRGKRRIELIETMLAYLLRYIKVPEYTESDSYVGYTLECMQDVDKEQVEFTRGQEKRYFKQRVARTEKLLEKTNEVVPHFDFRPTPELLAQRIKAFSPRSINDQCLIEMANRFLRLMIEFPERTLRGCCEPYFFDNDVEEESEEAMIDVGEYVSFFFQANDDLDDFLMREFDAMQQTGLYQEMPKAFQLFDTPQDAPRHDHTFEEVFFKALEYFIYCLYGTLPPKKKK